VSPLSPLQHLIAEASGLANGACSIGEHDWQSDGGRGCRRSEVAGGDCNGSQPVLVCARCGLTDYGDRGGPSDCDTGACGTAKPHCYTTPHQVF
jgi:hypothetical protein